MKYMARVQPKKKSSDDRREGRIGYQVGVESGYEQRRKTAAQRAEEQKLRQQQQAIISAQQAEQQKIKEEVKKIDEREAALNYNITTLQKSIDKLYENGLSQKEFIQADKKQKKLEMYSRELKAIQQNKKYVETGQVSAYEVIKYGDKVGGVYAKKVADAARRREAEKLALEKQPELKREVTYTDIAPTTITGEGKYGVVTETSKDIITGDKSRAKEKTIVAPFEPPKSVISADPYDPREVKTKYSLIGGYFQAGKEIVTSIPGLFASGEKQITPQEVGRDVSTIIKYTGKPKEQKTTPSYFEPQFGTITRDPITGKEVSQIKVGGDKTYGELQFEISQERNKQIEVERTKAQKELQRKFEEIQALNIPEEEKEKRVEELSKEINERLQKKVEGIYERTPNVSGLGVTTGQTLFKAAKIGGIAAASLTPVGLAATSTGLIASSIPNIGRGILGTEYVGGERVGISPFERTKELGIGTLKAGVGFLGTSTLFRGIEKELIQLQFKGLESKQFSIKAVDIKSGKSQLSNVILERNYLGLKQEIKGVALLKTSSSGKDILIPRGQFRSVISGKIAENPFMTRGGTSFIRQEVFGIRGLGKSISLGDDSGMFFVKTFSQTKPVTSAELMYPSGARLTTKTLVPDIKGGFRVEQGITKWGKKYLGSIKGVGQQTDEFTFAVGQKLKGEKVFANYKFQTGKLTSLDIADDGFALGGEITGAGRGKIINYDTLVSKGFGEGVGTSFRGGLGRKSSPEYFQSLYKQSTQQVAKKTATFSSIAPRAVLSPTIKSTVSVLAKPTVIATTTATQFKPKGLFKVSTSIVPEVKTSTRPLIKPTTSLKPLTSQRGQIKTLTKLANEVITSPATSEKVLTSQIVVPKQQTQLQQELITTPVSISIPFSATPTPPVRLPIRPFGFFGFPGRDFTRKDVSTGGFKAQALSGGKWKTLNKQPLPRNEAASLGARAVDETTSRRFRLLPAKGKVVSQGSGTYFGMNQYKFRDVRIKKGKGIKLPATQYIEKTSYAIDTPSEKKGLKLAKWMKQRRKPSKKTKNKNWLV